MSLDLTLDLSQFKIEMLKPLIHNIYEFEGFRLDEAHLLLYKDGREILLAPKVVETLLILVKNGGKVITKDKLMSEVWPQTIVEESNLSQNLFRLRKVLGKTSSGNPFIETLRRRGYRFTPEVTVKDSSEEVREGLRPRMKSEGVTPPSNKRLVGNYAENERNDFSPTVARILDFPGTKPEHHSQTAVEVEPRTLHVESAPPEVDAPVAVEQSSQVLFGKRNLLIGFVAACVVITTLGFALRSRLGVNPTDAMNLRRITESGNLAGSAISSDGNLLAYVVHDSTQSSLRLKNIQTDSDIVIIPPSEMKIGQPRFSPDSNFIFYSTSDGVFKMPVFGGDTIKIAADLWSNFSVSPDGIQIAFPRSTAPGGTSSLVVANADGSGERTIATRTNPEFYVGWGPAPAWSPDGEHLTAVTANENEEGMRVADVDLRTGEEHDLKMNMAWAAIEYIDWSGPNELLLAAHPKDQEKNQIWRVNFPGEASSVTRDFNNYLSFTLSGDKKKIVAMQEVENLHLWHFDAATGLARQVTTGVSRNEGRYGLALGSDGRIVFSAREKNIYDIYSVASDGTDMRQLTKNAGKQNIHGVVSPDNGSIAFISDRSGGWRLWLMNADGTGPRRLTTLGEDKDISEAAPFFSNDGRSIYYVLWKSGKSSIQKISLDGNEPVTVRTTDQPDEPVPSPDENLLAHSFYNVDSPKPWQVAIEPLGEATGAARSFSSPAFRFYVRWLLDSNSIVSIDDQSYVYNLWQTDLKTGRRLSITNFDSDKIYRFDVSPDRNSYVLSRGNYFYDAVLIEH